MKVNGLISLKEVADDLNEGKAFYDQREVGIESLIIYAGVHSKKNGLHRMLAKRFPYAIYYVIEDQIVHVLAVLPMRRDPAWVKKKLTDRV